MDETRDAFLSLVGGKRAGGASAETSGLDRSTLARGALLVGRVVHPDLDVGAGLAALETLASKVRSDDPAQLARQLFGSGRLAGNGGNYYDPENSVLTSVLERGLGIPITLSVVFIDVAARHGFVVEGVGMPGHFLTRAGHDFFDPFHAGTKLDAAGCERLYQRLAGRPVRLPTRSLDPTPPAAILQRMLWNLRSIAEGRNDPAMVHRVFSLLSALPDPPLQIRLGWARSLADRGRFGEAAGVVEAAIDVAPASAHERLQTMADRWAARLN